MSTLGNVLCNIPSDINPDPLDNPWWLDEEFNKYLNYPLSPPPTSHHDLDPVQDENIPLMPEMPLDPPQPPEHLALPSFSHTSTLFTFSAPLSDNHVSTVDPSLLTGAPGQSGQGAIEVLQPVEQAEPSGRALEDPSENDFPPAKRRRTSRKRSRRADDDDVQDAVYIPPGSSADKACPICHQTLSLSNIREAWEHWRVEHLAPQGQGQASGSGAAAEVVHGKCPDVRCKYEASSVTEHQRHFRSAHLGVLFTCRKCYVGFPRQDSFKKHRKKTTACQKNIRAKLLKNQEDGGADCRDNDVNDVKYLIESTALDPWRKRV